MTLPAHFWSKTTTTDCIVWRGAQNSKGYGCWAIGGMSHLAHRIAWEDARGPIPEGMTIDHLCRVRSCVNVEHMELVTVAENNRRKLVAGGLQPGAECWRGHRMTPANTYRHPRGHVECRECRRAQRRGAAHPPT